MGDSDVKNPLYKRPAAAHELSMALVIGGGIAGIQAALDISGAGFPVLLVERSPSIGGHALQLSETFPTLDCPQCILTPKMVELTRRDNVTIWSNAEVESVERKGDLFVVKIRRRAAGVIWEKCNGCGECEVSCPVVIPSLWDMGMGTQKAIYKPFPQAIPNIFNIHEDACIGCGRCEKACDQKAIDRTLKDRVTSVEVGAVVVATGYDLLPQEKLREYPQHPDVVDALQFERLLCPSGPTSGQVCRPSDGKVPGAVAFISCVGSRDPARYLGYCSQVCCLALAKAALLYHEAVSGGTSWIFYMERRAVGKGHETFLQRASEEARIHYIRGRPASVEPIGKSLLVKGYDTQENVGVEVEVDMVVLACAMTPSAGTAALWKKLGVQTDSFGYPSTHGQEGNPVATNVTGVFTAGAAEGPKDIPDCVLQGSAAASGAVLRLKGLGQASRPGPDCRGKGQITPGFSREVYP
jgi:heterodisulfide reductase subunit A